MRAGVSATRCTAVSPRVSATWNTRRSSSTSSARWCGINPSWTPSTTTFGHSMPLTRCTVESVTSPGAASTAGPVEHAAQPGLEAGRIRREPGDGDERVEIVAVTRLGPPPAAVEGLERAAEPDRVAYEPRAASRCRRPRAVPPRACRGRRGSRRAGRSRSRPGRATRCGASACGSPCVAAVRGAASGWAGAPRSRGRGRRARRPRRRPRAAGTRARCGCRCGRAPRSRSARWRGCRPGHRAAAHRAAPSARG